MKKNYNCLVVLFVLLFISSSIYSQTIYVNSSTGNDTTGDGSIGNPFKTFVKGYTIVTSGNILDLTGTFTWTNADENGDIADVGFRIQKNITIQGQDPTNTIIEASASPNSADRRVFEIVNGYTVTFKNLTIRHGRGFAGWIGMTYYTYHGGAIGSVYGGSSNVTLTLENVIISNNYSTTSGVAGVYNEGSFIATNCTFQNNTSTSSSGAIALELEFINFIKPRNIINCTFYNNTSTNSGGYAVFIDRRGANIINSTFIGNTNAIRAYALYGGTHELYIVNSIVANSAGYDLASSNGSANGVKCINSIVEIENAGSTAISYTNCIVGDQANLNIITPTTNDGFNHRTPYLNITASSVAIDAGTTGNFGSASTSGSVVAVPSVDQRGFSRTGNTDIGSIEFNGGAPLAVNNFNFEEVSLYPTYTEGIINISNNKEYNYSVYNILGKEIKTGKSSKTIDISGNIKGIYYVVLSNENGSKLIKIILK